MNSYHIQQALEGSPLLIKSRRSVELFVCVSCLMKLLDLVVGFFDVIKAYISIRMLKDKPVV